MVAPVTKTELDRIKDVYLGRIRHRVIDGYSPFAPGELYMLQRREEETLRLLVKHGRTDLKDLRILEVGCGRGARLLDWCRWGATPSLLHGIDLMEPFIREGLSLLPSSNLIVGTADRLPYRDRTFQIVAQLTVFTSILSEELKRAVAAEMCRVTAPGGLIVWYDLRYPNPRNPDVRAIGLREIRRLFDGWSADVRSLTLLPPLARKLARLSVSACRLLELTLPPLRSHYIAVLRKEGP
jgi:ubiquinone/menaquinone biosynthesis C-methylase UbiE